MNAMTSRATTVGILAASLVVGSAASLVAYDLATSGPTRESATAAADGSGAGQADRRDRGRRFAPCRGTARLVGDVCVIDEMRTVVLPAPVGAAAGTPTSSSGGGTPVPSAPRSDGSAAPDPGRQYDDEDDFDDDEYDDEYDDDTSNSHSSHSDDFSSHSDDSHD